MNLNIAICDDSFAIEQIQSHLQTFQIENNMDFHITAFSQEKDLLDAHSASNSYHVIFLDIEMPELNGLEIAKEIRERADYNTKIVFVSNYLEYMQDSFDVQAFHYLEKPLEYETMDKLLTQIIKQYKEDFSHTLLLPHDNIEELVLLKNIIYIEAVKKQKNTLKFVLQNKTIYVKDTLKNYISSLQKYTFAVPHRGYIVNLSHIQFFKSDTVILSNKESIPLSRRSKKTFRILFSEYIFQKIEEKQRI